jgi:uncharacterized membrane protein
VRADLILLAIGVALLLNAFVVELLPARMWRRRPSELQAAAERWEAFRRYLRDFPRADKPADSLPLWERYLVYGISFGIADRVLEAARLSFPGFDASALGAAAGGAGGYGASHFSADMDGAFPSASASAGDGGGDGGDFGGGGGGAW